MAKKPDTPCAGGCGILLWSGSSSLPAGKRTCRACRAAKPKPRTVRPARPVRAPQPCDDCGQLTLRSRNQSGRVCRDCARGRRLARYRAKNYSRRTVTRLTDITPAYERTLRRKATRCPMPGCGVRLVNTAGRPNSKELDHIIPINVGGTHTVGNVRIICRGCNSRRPSDGSDYAGQPTLWARDATVVATFQPRPAPEAKPQPPTCSTCGARTRAGSCATCRGRHARELRASGMEWREVAKRAGYASPGAAHNAMRLANCVDLLVA